MPPTRLNTCGWVQPQLLFGVAIKRDDRLRPQTGAGSNAEPALMPRLHLLEALPVAGPIAEKRHLPPPPDADVDGCGSLTGRP
jgi:hypothetical protein